MEQEEQQEEEDNMELDNDGTRHQADSAWRGKQQREQNEKS